MKCVVLGAGGFIGSNLALRLGIMGHEVIGHDLDLPDFRAQQFLGWDMSVSIVYKDLRTYDLTDAFSDADVVFHLAADMGGVGYFHSDADLNASLDNGTITTNVARAAAATGVRVFYASSACAYPTEMAGVVLTEDLVGTGTPDQLYGAEKLHGLRIMAKLPNARVGILHTVYGPLQEHEGRRMKFPAAVATKALAARQTGALELWGDGEQVRTYLHVLDAIDRILAITFADTYEGPVNVGSDRPVTCREIADLCLTLAGTTATITTNPAEPSGVLERRCSNAKYESLYGRAKDRGYESGFADFIAWLDTL